MKRREIVLRYIYRGMPIRVLLLALQYTSEDFVKIALYFMTAHGLRYNFILP